MTKIYLDNPDKFGFVTTLSLFDMTQAPYRLKESQLTREISNHMKTGSYTFSILPDHPAYNKILLKRSIVRVVDDNKTVFRGDVVKIDTDKYGVKKVTCQNDLKWLVDIPDVFSKWVPEKTIYNIGTEDGVVYQWFRDMRIPVAPGQPQQWHTYGGEKVYEHYERNNYISLKYIWSDFRFRAQDAGKKYTVTRQHDTDSEANGTWECELRMIQHPRAGSQPLTILYLGNLNMAPVPPGNDPAFNAPYTFDPADVDLTEYTATDISPGAPAEEIPLTDLDWCIVHYYDPLKSEVTGGLVNHNGRDETHIYTTVEPPSTGKHKDRIGFSCSHTSKTTIQSMVTAIFCEYSNEDPPPALTGYNACVEPTRRIYRGRMEIDGELENSSVNTIYSNLSRWLDVSGGYASIRYESNIAYLDLLPDSGVKDNSFSVELGENVSDYSKSEDVLKLVTGFYPVGRKTAENTGEEGEEQEEEQTITLKGAEIASQIPGFVFDPETGMVFHREAQLVYGRIVQTAEYDLQTVAMAQWPQYLYNKGCDEIRQRLEAFASFSISAYDPRLLGKAGGVPVLGNYYPVNIYLWGEETYMPLTKIITNHVKPSSDKLTYGDERAFLSDYVARRS